MPKKFISFYSIRIQMIQKLIYQVLTSWLWCVCWYYYCFYHGSLCPEKNGLSILSGLRGTCTGDTPSWHYAFLNWVHILHIWIVTCLVHSYADIWTIKISNSFFFLHFTNCPCICDTLTLYSLRFTYITMCYYWLSC